MTSSPDLIHELRASRPTAPSALRMRVRELSTREAAPAPWARVRFRVRRAMLIAVPAAAALALASAGVVGLSRSDVSTEALRQEALESKATPEAASPPAATLSGVTASTIGPASDRAQRVSATLTVEVSDSKAVSDAAQNALALTQRLGGHVVSASVVTGEEGGAALTVRVPVGKVQEAIVGLSALGRIVSQQVTIDDLQETLDRLERREASVRNQIARIVARLDTEQLDPETEAVLQSRVRNLRSELRELRGDISATNAEARMSTIQLTIVTRGASEVVTPPSRLDRTIDEALNVLAWEGVIALGILIVLAPLALLALATWLGRRLYRRREDERLLAA